MGEQETSVFEVSLLGPFHLVVDGEKVTNEHWKSKKALFLLKYFFAHYGKKLRKEVILDLLWPEEDPEDANRRLHTTVYFVRRMIQPKLGPYNQTSFVRYSNGMYWIDCDHCVLDTERFQQLYNEAQQMERSDPFGALQRYRNALMLYRGDFLTEEIYEDWTIQPRESYRELYMTITLRAAQLTADVNQDPNEAVNLCRQALTYDPYREDLHQAVMTYLIQGERYAEAAGQYRQVCDMLDDEFGLPPSPKTQALFDKMRTLAADITADIVVPPPSSDENGPLVCDRQTFDFIVTLSGRSQARHGDPFTLIEMTVPTGGTQQQWDTMIGLLRHTLRGSDVLCFDAGRILIQLPHTGRDGLAIVKRRIEEVLDCNDLPGIHIAADIRDDVTVSAAN